MNILKNAFRQEIIELKTKNDPLDRYRIRCLEAFTNRLFTCQTLDEVFNLPNVGKGILSRIDKILTYQTGTESLDAKKKNIPYIGKKTNDQLFRNHISLSSILHSPDVYRSNLNMNQYICAKYNKFLDNKIPRHKIETLEKFLNNQGCHFIICGSYRRGALLCKDIDILCVGKKHFHHLLSVLSKITIHDLTKKSSILKKYMGLIRWKNMICRIDVLCTSTESFIPSLVYFTGSKEENIRLRKKAKQMNMKLNEYGLFNTDGLSNVLQSENELYSKLQESYKSPIDR